MRHMFKILNCIQNIKHINTVWLDVMVKSCDILKDMGVLQQQLVAIVTTADEEEAIRFVVLQVLDYEFNVHAFQAWDRCLVNVILFPFDDNFLINISEEKGLEVFGYSNPEMWAYIGLIVGPQNLIILLTSEKFEHADLPDAELLASHVNLWHMCIA